VREALKLATRIALMKAGRIILLATPAEFVRSAEPLARDYLKTLEFSENSPEPTHHRGHEEHRENTES
jgi:ABC-type proline/glycine betaine transport system ATPase subunit